MILRDRSKAELITPSPRGDFTSRTNIAVIVINLPVRVTDHVNAYCPKRPIVVSNDPIVASGASSRNPFPDTTWFVKISGPHEKSVSCNVEHSSNEVVQG